MIRRNVFGAALAIAAAAPALAQDSCVVWDTDWAVPGIADGYAGAIGFYQSQVFVGGSFSGMAGVPNSDYIARYNPQSGAWSAVGAGINQGSTNAFGTSFATFDFGEGEELVFGGFFFNAANVSGTRSLARWNGARWANLNTGFGNLAIIESVWDLLVSDAVGGERRMYTVGSFPAIGGQTCAGIAYHDGKAWIPMNTAITGTFSPGAFEAEAFDDGSGPAIYVGGRLTTIDGQDTNLVGKWNGSGWSRVGSGITSVNVSSQISAMCVFDDGTGPALYMGGNGLNVGTGACSVVKWNGTSFTKVGQNLTGTVWDLIVFDDGQGPKLYLGGSAQPTTKYFSRLEGNTWVPAFGGASSSVFAATTRDGRAYVAGNFTTIGAGAQTAAGLAILERCNADCPADFDNDGFITGIDYDLYVAAFEGGGASADFDGDGFITGIDFDLYVAAYEAGC